MIKCIQRIPTEAYAYLELELEYETTEDAFIDHRRLLKLHEGGTGLQPKEWSKVRQMMMTKGECDPELMKQMNTSQRWWVNETKLAIRSVTKN